MSCHVYASHRSIVAQVVSRQGHVVNPTCWGLTNVLTRIQYAGWGATFVTGHRCNSYTQKIWQPGCNLATKCLPSGFQINTCFPFWNLVELSLKIMTCLSWQADFSRDVLKRTSEESALDRYSICIFELSKYGLISSKFQACRTRVSP